MNKLYFGDNLDVIKHRVAAESVDLVYLDPPFNSNADYSLLHQSPVGDPSDAQRRAFKDTWRWEEDAAPVAMDEIRDVDLDVFRVLQALQISLGNSDLMAYLAMMSVRLLQLRRIMKSTASLYLHCDPTASHYLKVILDQIFGPENFRNEITWKRTGSHGGSKKWGPVHDTLLFYTKTNAYTWNKILQAYEPGYIESKYRFEDHRGRFQDVSLLGAGTRNGASGEIWRRFDPKIKGRHWAIPGEAGAAIDGFSTMNPQQKLDALDVEGLLYWPNGANSFPRVKQYPGRGVPLQDCVFDIPALNSQARERLGYPTQKPLALLERIIAASSKVGDVVLDPFCGCGTTVHAAETLDRRWVGIDVSYDAILVIEDRLKTWLPAARYQVDGIPTAEREARALAKLEPHTFQEWAVGRLGGRSRGRGADRGIDGEIAFLTGHQRYGRAIVSVKAGQHVNPGMIRDLAGVVLREGADLGIFVCVNEPTREMKLEAHSSELVALPWGNKHKIQIVTAKELVENANVGLPTALNTINAAEHAKTQSRKRPPQRPSAEELRAQPPLPPMPISGGKRPIQSALPLDEPLMSAERPAGPGRHKRA